MNPDTGHLKELTEEEIPEFESKGYQEIPDSHKEAAKKKLAGLKEATVSLKSGGKLSRLCRQWRKEKRARYEHKLGRTEINRRRAKRRSKKIKGGAV